MEKMKVYIDTNTILDFFINQARYFRGKGELRIPEKAKFILDNIEKLNIVVSFLVEAEVMRELVAGHGVPEDIVRKTWKDFLKAYRCKYIERFEFNSTLVDLVAKAQMRLRTMFNFQHLFMAMKEDAYFISGDKDIVKKARQLQVYDKLISYIEFREMLSSTS